MVKSLEVMKRAITGPLCSERDYDLRTFSPKIREAIKEYDIKYDGETIIPSDDSLADDVFKAGLDFYCNVGTYCMDTERIIKFDENEAKEGLRFAPNKAAFGEGLDAGVLVPREIASKIPPWCFLGAGGAPVSSEEIFLSLVEAYALIPEINAVTTPALTSVSGVEIRPNSPLEILGTMRNAVLAREAFRRAGRPGLPIMNALATATSAPALIAALHPNYDLRPSDGYLVASYPELKVDFSSLNKACVLQSHGARIGGEYSPILGGYPGGPEGVLVAQVAYNIHGVLVLQATWHLNLPFHYKFGCTTVPEILWALSTYGQAITRNTRLLSLSLAYSASGPCTEMCLYELAAAVITAVASGLSIEAAGVAKAIHKDHLTPLEPRFAAEVAHATAATGMKREDANEIVNSLTSKYVDAIPNPPLGKKYQECFDMKTGKPSREYLDIYNRVKKELEDLGLQFEQ